MEYRRQQKGEKIQKLIECQRRSLTFDYRIIMFLYFIQTLVYCLVCSQFTISQFTISHFGWLTLLTHFTEWDWGATAVKKPGQVKQLRQLTCWHNAQDSSILKIQIQIKIQMQIQCKYRFKISANSKRVDQLALWQKAQISAGVCSPANPADLSCSLLSPTL